MSDTLGGRDKGPVLFVTAKGSQRIEPMRVVMVGRAISAASISLVLEDVSNEARSKDGGFVDSTTHALIVDFSSHSCVEVGRGSTLRDTSESASTTRVHVFAVGSKVVLELLVFSQQKFNFLLESLLGFDGIILLVLDVGLLLLPLGSFLLKGEELLGLLGLSIGALTVELLQSELIVLSFLIKESLRLSDSLFSISLDGVKLILESLFSFKCLLQTLLKGALLGQLGLAGQLTLFEEDLLLTLELLAASLQLSDLSLSALLHLLDQLLVLGLKLDDLERVSVFELCLALGGILGHSIEGGLEISLSIFTVLLGSVPLLLEELELAVPQSLFTIDRV